MDFHDLGDFNDFSGILRISVISMSFCDFHGAIAYTAKSCWCIYIDRHDFPDSLNPVGVTFCDFWYFHDILAFLTFWLHFRFFHELFGDF